MLGGATSIVRTLPPPPQARRGHPAADSGLQSDTQAREVAHHPRCLGPRAPDPLRAVPADTSCALCTQHRAGPAPHGCACVWQVCPPCGHVALQCQTPSERAAGPSKGTELTGSLGSEGARPPIPGRPSTPSPRWEPGSLRIQGGVGTAGPEADAGPMAAGPVPHDRRDEACVRSLAALTPFDFLGPCGAWAGFSSRAPRRRRLLVV